MAIHAKDADEDEANTVLRQADQQANSLLKREPTRLFRLQGGHRFLEFGPHAADKKQTVEYILSTYPWDKDALLVYLALKLRRTCLFFPVLTKWHWPTG
jgi:hypothetical protein